MLRTRLHLLITMIEMMAKIQQEQEQDLERVFFPFQRKAVLFCYLFSTDEG